MKNPNFLNDFLKKFGEKQSLEIASYFEKAAEAMDEDIQKYYSHITSRSLVKKKIDLAASFREVAGEIESKIDESYQ